MHVSRAFRLGLLIKLNTSAGVTHVKPSLFSLNDFLGKLQRQRQERFALGESARLAGSISLLIGSTKKMGVPLARFLASSYLLWGTAASSASHGERQRPQLRRNLLGVDRTASVDTTGLICQLGQEHALPGVVPKTFEIPYYYALGTTGAMDHYEMHKLSMRLFLSVKQAISWCYTESIEVVAAGENDGNNRALTKKEQQRDLLLMERARKLGILSISTGLAKYGVGTSIFNQCCSFSLLFVTHISFR